MDLTNHTSTALTFTENNHGNVVLTKLYEQLAESRYCDVVLHVQNRTYSAHRCVLASCSSFFEAAFKESSPSKDHLTIKSHDLEIFETVFTYIYTGKVMIDFNTVGEILRLSTYLVLRELKGYCIEYLERSLQINNVYFTLDIAEKWNLDSLSKTIHGFILANLLQVVEQDEILGFDEYKIEAFISNKSFPLMEDMKIHIICKWVVHDIIRRHPYFQKLMSHIQWTRMKLENLYHVFQTEQLFTDSEYCNWYMLKLLQERGLLMQAYTETLHYLEKKVRIGQTSEQIMLSQQKEEEQLQDNKNVTDETVKTYGVEDLEEPKLILVDQTMGDKGSLIIDEDSDDIPLEYASDADMEQSSKISEEKEDVAMETTVKLPDNDMSKLDNMDVSSVPSKGEEVCSVKKESTELKQQLTQDAECEKRKRKGLPVKLKIPKSKLKMNSVNNPKKKGRPGKSVETKKRSLPKRGRRRKNEASVLEAVPVKHVKQEANKSETASDVVNSRVRKHSADQKTKPIVQRTRLQRKKGQRRKKLKHEKKPFIYQCEHCNSKFEDDQSLLSHLQLSHQDVANYACSTCGFNTLWNREYYKHMKTHFTGPPYECDYEGCEHVSERIQPFIYHRMRHTDERPFLCATCNMKFRTKNNLSTHMRCHTGEKPWNCEVCGRNFATKGTLDQHSVTHSEVRPYLCDTCGFSTKYQSHLIAHKRIHAGDVFRCQFPDCKYSTPKKSQLACHMRSHMSIRQHICATCSRAFVEKSHLVRHERIHLEDKPFKCRQCDYSSTRRDKLKEHITKYHGEKGVKSQYKPRKPRKPTFDPQAFPDCSQDGALRIQQEFDGQMEKSVQQRNEAHAQIMENRDPLKEQSSMSLPTTSNASVTTTNSLTPDLSQLKNLFLSTEVAGHSSNQQVSVANPAANENAVIPGVTYSSDSLTTPMVIEPNSATGNILLSNVAFTLDSRNNIGFVQTQGVPAQAGPANIVTSTLQPLPQISHDNLSAMVSYANLGTAGTGHMPLIALSGQTLQTATADLSQLPNLAGGFF